MCIFLLSYILCVFSKAYCTVRQLTSFRPTPSSWVEFISSLSGAALRFTYRAEKGVVLKNLTPSAKCRQVLGRWLEWLLSGFFVGVAVVRTCTGHWRRLIASLHPDWVTAELCGTRRVRPGVSRCTHAAVRQRCLPEARRVMTIGGWWETGLG